MDNGAAGPLSEPPAAVSRVPAVFQEPRDLQSSPVSRRILPAGCPKRQGVGMSDVTRILNAIERGDAKATDELLPLVYSDNRRNMSLRAKRGNRRICLLLSAITAVFVPRMKSSPVPPGRATLAHRFNMSLRAKRGNGGCQAPTQRQAPQGRKIGWKPRRRTPRSENTDPKRLLSERQYLTPSHFSVIPLDGQSTHSTINTSRAYWGYGDSNPDPSQV